jgi:hypothetical protein
MHEKEQLIKKFFGRKSKDYRFLTSPFMFSSALCRALDVELGAAHCISFCSCEAAWHGEFVLKSDTKYKPTELFFEAMIYQKKLNWWRELKIMTNDISKQYPGIVMQSKSLKEHRYENQEISYQIDSVSGFAIQIARHVFPAQNRNHRQHKMSFRCSTSGQRNDY